MSRFERGVSGVWPIRIAGIAAAAFVVATVISETPAQQPIDSAERPLRQIMKRKLDYSKNVLEGLAMEDYAKIRKNAQALSLLSLESGWKVLQTEEYVQQSREFRRAADQMTEAAREQNLDRSTLGYVSMTLRCVECHNYLRAEHPDLSGVAQPADRTE